LKLKPNTTQVATTSAQKARTKGLSLDNTATVIAAAAKATT
jgi:hypothetical protein